MTDQEILALRESGLTRADIAAKTGKTERQVKSALERARRDPAVAAGMAKIGTGLVPSAMWVKTDTHSVLLKPEAAKEDDFITRLAEAFSDIPAYEATEAEFVWSDLMTVYPVMDLHMGMYAWGDETGGVDYDLQHAENDIKRAFGSLAALTPASGDALLILGGDTLHADSPANETPKSKHKLDVDGRQFKVLDTAVRAIAWMVDHLAARHPKVTVRVLAGNHDPSAHLVLTFALYERYRNVDRIVIDKSPMDLLMFRHGNSLIAAHHGDKAPPQRLAMVIADACPFWSEVRHRHILTGHIHHESAKDFPGIKWESLRAFCPQDAYGAMFGPRRAMQAMVFDYHKGRVLVASDPIGRDE